MHYEAPKDTAFAQGHFNVAIHVCSLEWRLDIKAKRSVIYKTPALDFMEVDLKAEEPLVLDGEAEETDVGNK